MSLHCFDNIFGCAEFLENTTANLYVRPLDFMVDGFADIVKKGAGFGDLDVGAELFSEHSRNMGHFYGMLEDIVAIAGTEMKAPKHLEDARVEIYHATLICSLNSLILRRLTSLSKP